MKNSIPLQMKSFISPQTRAKSSDALKLTFAKCPNCNRYSLKPNYNMMLVREPSQLPDIIKKYGRRCICGFISQPNTEVQQTLL